MNDKLRNIIKELISDILKETSGTGGIDGYSTPNWVSADKSKKGQDKKLKKIVGLGMKPVPNYYELAYLKDSQNTLEDEDDSIEQSDISEAKVSLTKSPFDTVKDTMLLKKMIRTEVANILWDLFRKRKSWV